MDDSAHEGHAPKQELVGHQGNVPSPAAQELELLKRDLIGATAVVAKIKTRMNALAPINRLPLEVLTHIFSILSEEERPLAPLTPMRSPRLWRLGWIVITHVCKHWRDLAVACPSLWKSVIFSLGRPWAQCMLTHSKQFPISIEAYLKYMIPLDSLCILGHVGHTQSLSLVVESYSQVLHSFMTILALPAPMLRILRLEYTKKIQNVNEVINKTPNLFADSNFALRHIELRNVFVPWTFNIFTRLHHLSVMLPFDRPSVLHRPWAPSMIQLLDLLETMPDLQVLALQGCLPFVGPGSTNPLPSPGARKIALPRLSSLDLAGHIDSVALVLGHLALPLNVELDLSLVGINEATLEEQLLQFWSLLSSVLTPAGVVISLDRLDVGLDSEAFNIAGYTESETEGPSRFTLSFHTGLDDQIVKSFLSIFPLERIPTIKLYDMPIHDETWHSVFHQPISATIHALTLEEQCYFGGFVEFLGGGRNSEKGLPLRNLHSLTLIRAAWEGELSRFKQALQTRKKRGMPLQKLVIDWRNDDVIRDTWEHAFEGIVPEVVVHYENFEEDYVE